jgi:hypothetical protein
MKASDPNPASLRDAVERVTFIMKSLSAEEFSFPAVARADLRAILAALRPDPVPEEVEELVGQLETMEACRQEDLHDIEAALDRAATLLRAQARDLAAEKARREESERALSGALCFGCGVRFGNNSPDALKHSRGCVTCRPTRAALRSTPEQNGGSDGQ